MNDDNDEQTPSRRKASKKRLRMVIKAQVHTTINRTLRVARAKRKCKDSKSVSAIIDDGYDD